MAKVALVLGICSLTRKIPSYCFFSNKRPRKGSHWPELGHVARECSDLIGQVLSMSSPLGSEARISRKVERERAMFAEKGGLDVEWAEQEILNRELTQPK